MKFSLWGRFHADLTFSKLGDLVLAKKSNCDYLVPPPTLVLAIRVEHLLYMQKISDYLLYLKVELEEQLSVSVNSTKLGH